jgi:hypothetical protein
MGLTIYAPDGVTEVWNSDTAGGGVIATSRVYAKTDTDVLYFPAFAGRNACIVNLSPSTDNGNVVLDTALGYPRVTIGTSYNTRKFALVVR